MKTPKVHFYSQFSLLLSVPSLAWDSPLPLEREVCAADECVPPATSSITTLYNLSKVSITGIFGARAEKTTDSLVSASKLSLVISIGSWDQQGCEQYSLLPLPNFCSLLYSGYLCGANFSQNHIIVLQKHSWVNFCSKQVSQSAK